jgi:hypothetical protein
LKFSNPNTHVQDNTVECKIGQPKISQSQKWQYGISYCLFVWLCLTPLSTIFQCGIEHHNLPSSRLVIGTSRTVGSAKKFVRITSGVGVGEFTKTLRKVCTWRLTFTL